MRAMETAGREALATDRDGRRMPVRVGRRTARREIERFARDLDRPAHELVDVEALRA